MKDITKTMEINSDKYNLLPVFKEVIVSLLCFLKIKDISLKWLEVEARSM